MRLVYVSPLKALSYDIERNLRAPLRGIGADISVGLRTGDTPQTERRAMRKTPPDILITTPESLYLMLSSGAREILATTEAVIVDEIHAVAQSKRGSHLALTLERLELAGAGDAPTRAEGLECLSRPVVQRIGLSATQRPLERIAQFLVGPKRECEIVDAGGRKELDLEIVVPVEDMAEPGRARTSPAARRRSPAERASRLAHDPRSIWPAIYPELLKLVREHTSTIIFVNNRRGAERLAKRLNELANEEGEPSSPPPSTGALGTTLRAAAGGSTGPAEDPSRSPAPTTGRSPTRSGRSSRSCSSRGSCPASSRPPRWSWGSTWARSTS